MDRESKMLLGTLAGLIIVSLFLTYYRSFISKDFNIVEGEEATTAQAADGSSVSEQEK